MMFCPTFSNIAPDAVPEVTGVPSTITDAFKSLVVGVRVIDVMLLATDTL